MPEFKRYKQGKNNENHPVLRNPVLRLLLDDARENMDRDYTKTQQVRLLSQLYSMKLRDENVLEMFAQRVRDRQFMQTKDITNILYWFAKFKWRSAHGDDYLKVASQILLAEPTITSYTACRNLWNFYAFDYYDKVALERFSKVILDTKADQLNELDIANAVRSFSHFQHMDYDCLEVLLKQTIRRADTFKLQSLAVILQSFAELDISNPTLLTISKQILLWKSDSKAVSADGQPLITQEKHVLTPIDCAMFMSAFSRAEFFDDVALQESLMNCFLERIEQADGPTTVTMLNAHSAWCHHMIETVLI